MTWKEFFEEYGRFISAMIPVFIVYCILPTLFWIAKRRAASCSSPRPATTRLVRWSEVAMWSAGCGLLLIIFYAGYADYLRTPDTVPEMKIEFGKQISYLALASVPVVIAAVFRRLRLAAAGIVLLLSFSTIAVRPAYEWSAVEAAVANSPMPFRIESPPDLPAVEVTVNDVPFGTTPVVTTWEDIKERTPTWDDSTDHRKQTDRGSLAWCPMRVVHMGRRSHGGNRDELQLYLRFTLGKIPLYLYDASSFKWSGFARQNFTSAGTRSRDGMRINAQVTPMSIAPLLTLPEWGDDVQFLMHRARLTDYVVDDAWCTAFASYGLMAEIALMGLTEDDRRLERVAESLAMRKYPQVAEALSEREAWQRLLALLDEFGRSREFQFDGLGGAAVRLLASRLSDELLARETAAELDRVPVERHRSIQTSWTNSRRASLIRITPHDETLDGRWLRPHVLEQLAIARDAALDAVAPEPDNPIEIHVTPALMRQHRVGDGGEKQIGGRAYEQALMRHNWRQQPPDPNVWDDAEHGFAKVNHWLKCLSELDSPAGRQFRIEHAHQFLGLAEETWANEPNRDRLPESLDFLFREHSDDFPKSKDGKPGTTLAERFWPSFTGHLGRFSHEVREELHTRWNYLARMSPDSRPEQFVKELRELQPDWPMTSGADFLTRMPSDQAVGVLAALIEEYERQAADPKAKPPMHGYGHERAQLFYAALRVDDAGVVDLLFAEFDRPDTYFQPGKLAEGLREGRIAPKIVERLATCERLDIRKLVAETGLFLTRPEDRQRIERLSHDPDAEVAQAAQAILQQWAQWSVRPLPTRVLPVAGSGNESGRE
jgi:hypothetical protein